jgi:hypothetical protein
MISACFWSKKPALSIPFYLASWSVNHPPFMEDADGFDRSGVKRPYISPLPWDHFRRGSYPLKSGYLEQPRSQHLQSYVPQNSLAAEFSKFLLSNIWRLGALNALAPVTQKIASPQKFLTSRLVQDNTRIRRVDHSHADF